MISKEKLTSQTQHEELLLALTKSLDKIKLGGGQKK